jgi:hypothetical protein
MKTTIELPDKVFRRAKAEAALEGRSLRAFVLDAVVHELEHLECEPKGKRIELPLVRSRHPGSLRLDGKRVAEALAAEDLNALA